MIGMMLHPIRTLRRALAGWMPGGRRQCAVCNRQVWRFMPYRSGSQSKPPLMNALGMVGSNREQFACPRCNAHDRERHLLMYLRASGLLAKFRGRAILHFAPENQLQRFIAESEPIRYVRADLHPTDPDFERVDLLSIPYDDAAFDFVIANHVLEHVLDVDRALREVFRVLRLGGMAILQTPYSSMLMRTWEDAGIDTDAARLQAYGQEDHVRLFGRDIFDRIVSTGFENHVSRHTELLPGVDATKAGVNPQEPFFLFRKPA